MGILNAPDDGGTAIFKYSKIAWMIWKEEDIPKKRVVINQFSPVDFFSPPGYVHNSNNDQLQLVQLKNGLFYELVSEKALNLKICYCKRRFVTFNHAMRCTWCPRCKHYYSGSSHNESCNRLPIQMDVKSGHRLMSLKTDLPTSKKLSNNYQFYADFETFHHRGRMVVYAAAIKSYDDRHDKMWIGNDAIDQFLTFIFSTLPSNATVWFYNGSKFDFMFIVEGIMNYNRKKDTLIGFGQKGQISYHNNKIVQMTVNSSSKKMWHFKDLYLFTMCSLKAACKDFGLPLDQSKGDFEHEKIIDWLHVDMYKDEISEYLSLDVISLRALYQKLNELVQDKFGIGISSSCSLSNLAVKIWLQTLSQSIRKELWLPTHNEDQLMRKAYYGGRTLCQKKLIKEAKYIDAVSLYPSQMMFHLYPYGQFIYHDSYDYEEFITLLYSPNEEDWSIVYYGIWCVNVKCPKNIITPFLMEKREKGGMKMTLDDKVKQWYVGAEIMHAVLQLNYEVTAVHAGFTFPLYGNLFDDYIRTAFEMKKSSQRGTAPYQFAKLQMNGLSGKLGQRSVDKAIYIKPLGKMKKEDIVLFNAEGVPMCTYKEEDKQGTISYPVYLTAFILAYSRIYMSDVLLKCGGYYNMDHAFAYQDTDSYIISRETYDRLLLSDTNVMGKEMLMMNDELDGGEIQVAIMLAPKTYAFIFRDTKTNRLIECIKAKGIPQKSYQFPFSGWQLPSASLNSNLYRLAIKQQKEKGHIIGFLFQMKFFKIGDDHFVEHLNTYVYHQLMEKKIKVISYFTSLHREMFSLHQVNTMTLILCERQLNKEDWWAGCERIFVNDWCSVPSLYQ